METDLILFDTDIIPEGLKNSKKIIEEIKSIGIASLEKIKKNTHIY